MFKKSDKNIQGNLFSGISSILTGNSLKQYNDTNGWYNQFYKQIVLLIKESIFKNLLFIVDSIFKKRNKNKSVL